MACRYAAQQVLSTQEHCARKLCIDRKAIPPEGDDSEPSSVDGEDDDEEGEADLSDTEVDESLYGKG